MEKSIISINAKNLSRKLRVHEELCWINFQLNSSMEVSGNWAVSTNEVTRDQPEKSQAAQYLHYPPCEVAIDVIPIKVT